TGAAAVAEQADAEQRGVPAQPQQPRARVDDPVLRAVADARGTQLDFGADLAGAQAASGASDEARRMGRARALGADGRVVDRRLGPRGRAYALGDQGGRIGGRRLLAHDEARRARRQAELPWARVEL